MYLALAEDHNIYNSVDKKHFTNFLGHEITGILEGVPVGGNFQNAKLIIACVSPNSAKTQHMFYTIGADMNNAQSSMAFVEMMVVHQFLKHGELLVMDNAPVHTGSAASTIKDFL